jgi:LPXTG-motif cell wall-anchored protein
MLAMTTSNGSPYLLGDGLSGTSDVQALQQALKSLATAAKYPAGDPGAIDGVVGQQTVQALALWLPKIPKVPSAVGTVLKLASVGYGLLPESTRKTVQTTISSYAKELAVGVNAVYALYTGNVPSPPAVPGVPPAPSSGSGLFNLNLPFRPLLPSAAAGKYKAGSVARFNTTRGVWSIYSPLAGAGFGLGLGVVSDGHCMGGECLGEVNPPVPVGFVKTGEELAPPSDVAKSGQETDKTPLYKNPYFWLAIGGAVVVAGGGFYLVRRRRTTS